MRPSCAEQTDRLEPAVRLWSTSAFLFSGLLLAVWFDDAARAIDDVGWRRRCASYGVIDKRSENLQH